MSWREQSLKEVRDLAMICSQGISPVETLSSHRASYFAAQVLGDEAKEWCNVGGARDQYGFGHLTHLVTVGAVQPQTFLMAGNRGQTADCISADTRVLF